MNKKRIIISAVIFLGSVAATFAQTKATVKQKDFQTFVGNWKGTLTYLDYSSNKPYTMPADLEVRQSKNPNVFLFSNLYPDEPKANSSDTLTISDDGKMVNNETVKSKRKLSNGNTEIIAERSGRDGNDNKPALIRMTYTVGKNRYTNVKEVKFTGQKEWIKRHEYSYTRK
jgi:hypothetical protein